MTPALETGFVSERGPSLPDGSVLGHDGCPTGVEEFRSRMTEARLADFRGRSSRLGRERAHAMRRRMGRLGALVILGTLAGSLSTSVGLAQAVPTKSAQNREDLARDKPATASTFQTDDKWPAAAFDGDPETRWCASDGSAPQWLQVDLGQPETLTGCRIVWEHGDAPYPLQGRRLGRRQDLVNALADQTAERARKPRTATTSSTPEGDPLRPPDRDRASSPTTGRASSPSRSSAPSPPRPSAKACRRRRPTTEVDPPGDQGPRRVRGDRLRRAARRPLSDLPGRLARRARSSSGSTRTARSTPRPNRGRVVRCVDTDGDGKADKFNVFASMDSPRGLIWDAGTLYVLHPPILTAFTDTNGDGVADKSEVLVKGIGFDLKFRGADHTTNGIRLGIDGYIYIAVGDYGFVKAEGKDGTAAPAPRRRDRPGPDRRHRPGDRLARPAEHLRRRHRPLHEPLHPRQHQRRRRLGRPPQPRRPDRPLRLPLALQAVPRRAHPAPGRLRRRLPLRLALPPGAATCPKPYGDMLYTCEWGRGGIFMHPLDAERGRVQGRAGDVPRDPPADRHGRRRPGADLRLELAGRRVQLLQARHRLRDPARRQGRETGEVPRPQGRDRRPTRRLPRLATSAVLRLAAQREMLRRGRQAGRRRGLWRPWPSSKTSRSPAGSRRSSPSSKGSASRLDPAPATWRRRTPTSASSPSRPWPTAGKTRRRSTPRPSPAYLADPNPRVRLQAVVALGRFGHAEVAPAILPADGRPRPAGRPRRGQGAGRPARRRGLPQGPGRPQARPGRLDGPPGDARPEGRRRPDPAWSTARRTGRPASPRSRPSAGSTSPRPLMRASGGAPGPTPAARITAR